MRLNLITAPAAEPITISDVEGQSRLGAGAIEALGETASVNLFISAIRQRAEAFTRRALITQTWELVLDNFPLKRGAIEIPLPPLQSVTSVTYVDPNGNEQTFDPALYRVESDVSPTCQPGRVLPIFGQVWPATLRDEGVIRIRFTAGYGDEGNLVPEGIRQWALVNVANLYENRESETVASGRLTQVDLSTFADGLIADFRVFRW